VKQRGNELLVIRPSMQKVLRYFASIIRLLNCGLVS